MRDDEVLYNLPPANKWDRRMYAEDDRALLDRIMAAEKSTFAAPASATGGLQDYDLEGARARRRKRRKRKSTTEATDPAMGKSAMSDELNLFIPLTKIDAAKRLVYGVATAEKPDVAGEVCDYASTKPLYQRWSDGFARATEGKSLGNLRVMHGNIAAGKLTDIAFNDEAKQIEICAKVVDDAEWNKVQEGVYSGFSQGGKYVKRWKDGEFTRYTAEPIEVSLVDNPCLPDATFSVIKVDGSTELRKFVKADPAAREEKKAQHHDAKAKEHAEAANRAEAGSGAAKAHRQAADEHEKAADLHRKAAAQFKAGNSDAADKMADEADDQSDKAEEVGDAANETAKSAGANGDWRQVWECDRIPGKTFTTKAALAKALIELDAEETAKKAAAPVLDALGGIEKMLAQRDADAGDAEKIYKSNEDLPAPVRKLPSHGQDIYRKAFNSAYKEYDSDEAKSHATAWAAVEQEYEKDKDGNWTAKKSAGDGGDLAKHIVKEGDKWVLYNKETTKKLGSFDTKREAEKQEEAIQANKAAAVQFLAKQTRDAARKSASLFSLSNLLLLLDSVQRAEDAAESNAWDFGPSVELPQELTDRFGAALVELVEIATEMLDAVLAAIKQEEASEAVAAAARMRDLIKLMFAKVGARHSAADKERIQQAHDLLAELDPDCCPGAADDAEKLRKTLEAERAANGKLLNEMILPTISKLSEAIVRIGADVKTIADQPMPMGHSSVTLRTVDKAQDFDAVANQLGAASGADPLTRLADAAQRLAQRR